MTNRPFRPTSSRDAAEAAFKKVTDKKPPLPEETRSSIPGVKEQVTLRIDREILDYFQADGPGWQDRIVEALRKVAGK